MNLIAVLESHSHTVPRDDQEKGSWSWDGGATLVGGEPRLCLETGRAPVTCTERPLVASVILDPQHPSLFLVSGHALFPWT